jgi:hypothetical protein
MGLSFLAITLEIILYKGFHNARGLKSSNVTRASFFGIIARKVELSTCGTFHVLLIPSSHSKGHPATSHTIPNKILCSIHLDMDFNIFF